MKTEADIKLEKLTEKLKTFYTKNDLAMIKKAYRFAVEHHGEQLRKSGDAFIVHPLAVAGLLADLRLDPTTIITALLHDVVEDTEVKLTEIREKFGDEVAKLIKGLTKLDLIKFSSQEQEQAENIRKMIVAMAKDIRIILIKLADRLHNMKTISHMSRPQQLEKARETLEIYAPLSHRLGIFQFKWQLEDLSFQVLEPQKYKEIRRMVAGKHEEREKYLADVISVLKNALDANKVEAEISGRPKHLYSIYQKMVKKEKDFNEIYDLMAIRLIVNSVTDCYAAIGTIHNIWKPIPGRFKDYIAMPKFNLYQSLHTTVIGPHGKPLEVQVRTSQMHYVAEFGIAAHWRYKEQDQSHINYDLSWLKSIIEWQHDLMDATDFIESLKIDLFDDEVFVFTPKGKVIGLSAEATPIDFAYMIHTDIGNTCVGALVNNRIVPLSYKLENGDIVEILTSKNAHPSRDWLQIASTAKARSKIRQWFAKNRKEDSFQLGKEVLQKAMRKKRLASSVSEIGVLLENVAKDYSFKTSDDLITSIGEGTTSVSQVVAKLSNLMKAEEKTEKTVEILHELKAKRRHLKDAAVKVHGVKDVLVRLARCCSPMPGDEIMGFITIGRGISVHTRECRNVPALLQTPERQVDVSWEDEQAASFRVEIEVMALDRKGLLKDITTAISDAKINIDSAKVNIGKDKTAIFRFVFEISSIHHLSSILSTIKKIDSVLDAYRIMSHDKTKLADTV